nr:ribonuclease H-like domain-containing protein [Tanacetum cinerariifolium]
MSSSESDVSTLSHPRGIVYEGIDNKKSLMRADEIHKFNDGTLNKIYNKLKVILRDNKLGFNNEGMETESGSIRTEKGLSQSWKRLRRRSRKDEGLKRSSSLLEEEETRPNIDGFEKHNQLMKLMQFLMGLDDSYMQIRSSILFREVLPDVRSAYATISSEESHRVVVGSIAGSFKRNQAFAFVSNAPNRNNFQRNNQNNSNGPSRLNNLNNNRQGRGSELVCEDYGFNGHTIGRCFKIIGYPADFRNKKSNQSFKWKNVSNNNFGGTSSSSGFTDEQMATLISIIKDNKNGNNVHANMAAIENKIVVAFDESKCCFLKQDLSLRSVPGTSSQCEGLYHYNNQEPVFNVLKSLQIDNNDKINNSENDDDSSDDIVATQNEEVATLEENIFSKDALLRNGTWERIELAEGRKSIGSKWIYKIKYRSSSEIDNYKARLVALGLGQKEGIDYEETFYPIVQMVTLRCLLNTVVAMSWHDFRQWNAKLTCTLIENGFSQSDYSLYTKSDKGVFLALLIYMDDIIITGNNVSEIEKFKVFLKSKFMIKDLGKLKYFLGIEVVDTKKGICLNQRKYVLDLLSEY